MAHSDRLQPSYPPTLPEDDMDTVDIITKKLNIRSPYRKYPPCGVPCPEGSNTFHLALRREKWWEMLQEHAWKEKVMMQRMRIEDERKERLKQMWQQEEEEANAAAEAEQMRQRKDSLVVEEKDVEYADTRGPGDERDNTASAICSSSEEGNDEEVPPEQTKDVKGRKTSTSKGSGKGHAQGHKVRRAKPLSGVRTHARQGSGASSSSSKTPS